MSSINRHVILNHIDSPIKILFWNRGELLMLMGPFFLGLLSDFFIEGVFLSLFNWWVVSKYKSLFGKGQLQSVMYWHFPHAKKRLKKIPPSYIREYVG